MIKDVLRAGMLGIAITSSGINSPIAETQENIRTDLFSSHGISTDLNLTVPPPLITPEPSIAPETEISEKPNIVVIMIDDVNPIDGRLWTKNILPTIHANFVTEGVEYVNFHTETPLCCPARVGFLTGQHTQNHGVLDNLDYVNNFDDSETIATALDREGYFTFIAGKGLNAMRSLKDPDFDGFDRQAVIFEGNGHYYDYDLLINGKKKEHYGKSPSDYSTDVIRDKAVGFLKDAPKDAPIFAFIAPYAAHEPSTPAPRHEDDERCDDIEPWTTDEVTKPHDLEKICRTLLSVDDLTKSVVNELIKQGRLKNTILVFTADNGMAWSVPGTFAKANEYSVDIPLFIKWPKGRGKDAGINTDVYTNIDLAPTLVEAGGGELGPYPNGQLEPDGISFYKTIIDETSSANIDNGREFILLQEPVDIKNKSAWWAIKTTEASNLGSYYFVVHKNGDYELYDYSQDPNCQTNIANDPMNSGIVEALSLKLVELKKPFKADA